MNMRAVVMLYLFFGICIPKHRITDMFVMIAGGVVISVLFYGLGYLLRSDSLTIFWMKSIKTLLMIATIGIIARVTFPSLWNMIWK